MTDDLVKRLRMDWDTDQSILSQVVSWDNDRREAADRIEQLVATNKQLTAERDELVQTSAILCDDCGWAMKFPNFGCVYCGFHRLEKERDALTAERDGLLRCVTDNHVALCRAETAEAERDSYRKALEGLMVHEPDYSDTLWQDAREALNGETP